MSKLCLKGKWYNIPDNSKIKVKENIIFVDNKNIQERKDLEIESEKIISIDWSSNHTKFTPTEENGKKINF